MASAIEYFMTYGWILLVVTIVGMAIFVTVQEDNQYQNDINETELENSVAAQGGFNTCEYSSFDLELECFRPLQDLENSTLEISRTYHVDIHDNRTVISEK